MQYLKIFRFMCMNLLCACRYVYHIHAWCFWNSEAGSVPLELELWIFVSHERVTGNEISVLCKNSKRSQLLSHLFSSRCSPLSSLWSSHWHLHRFEAKMIPPPFSYGKFTLHRTSQFLGRVQLNEHLHIVDWAISTITHLQKYTITSNFRSVRI